MAWLSSFFASIGEWSTSDKIAFVNCILTGFFLLATIISVICAFKAYTHQKERARKEAACDLARYYAENVIVRHGFVSTVMQTAGIEEKAKDFFPYKELSSFSKSEMLEFLRKKEITHDMATDIFVRIDPQAVLNAKLSFTTSVHGKTELIKEYIVTDKKTGEKQIAFPMYLQTEFLDRVCDFLNDLEWFSMSCRYGISDEEVLYQSLHTTFLSTVWLLYFYICDQNDTNEDKLFTNIIWLFHKWRGRLARIQKTAEREQTKAQRKVEDAERKRSAAEKKLDQAKPKIHSGKPLK